MDQAAELLGRIESMASQPGARFTAETVQAFAAEMREILGLVEG
jgi:hypothetical protein